MNISTENQKNLNSNENEVNIRQRRSGGVLIVIVSAVFVVFFILAYISNPVTSKIDSYEFQVIERPSGIGELLRLTTERGLETKSLIPIKKSDSQVIEQASIPVSLLFDYI